MNFKSIIVATAFAVVGLATPALAEDQGTQINAQLAALDSGGSLDATEPTINPVRDALAALAAGMPDDELMSFYGYDAELFVDSQLELRDMKDARVVIRDELAELRAEQAGPITKLETWQSAKDALARIYDTYVATEQNTSAIITEMTNIDVKIVELELIVNPIRDAIAAKEDELEAADEAVIDATRLANSDLNEFVKFVLEPVVGMMTVMADAFDEQSAQMASLERGLAEVCQATGNHGNTPACANVTQAVAGVPPIPALRPVASN